MRVSRYKTERLRSVKAGQKAALGSHLSLRESRDKGMILFDTSSQYV